MQSNLQLSNNLTLTSIEENNFKGADLIAVVCYFTFFGEEGTAFIATSKLDSEHASYGIIEMTSELSDSFVDQIEDEGNWKKIVAEVRNFIKEWNLIQAE